jgi:S-adenosylmethionine hydrolase
MTLHRKLAFLTLLLGLLLAPALAHATDGNGLLVLESDYGLRDGSVAAMKGVALGVDPKLRVEDLTHAIPPFDIWAGGYQLAVTAPYWPRGTVFVVVVDPGVGTERRAIALETKAGHYVVGPDNGLMTLIAEQEGVAAVRLIDEAANRLPGSQGSRTFEGRDVFAYVGARLAAGVTGFDAIGAAQKPDVVRLPYQAAAIENGKAVGIIPALDASFGNVWTNIDLATFERLGIAKEDLAKVTIRHGGAVAWEGTVPWVSTYGDVTTGAPLLYVDSAGDMALAINLGSFADTYAIGSGPSWGVEITPAH